MSDKIKLDNVDKEVLQVLKNRNKGTQPSFILKVMGKKPQAISRSLKKLKESKLIDSMPGFDKRTIFYVAR